MNQVPGDSNLYTIDENNQTHVSYRKWNDCSTIFFLWLICLFCI